MEFLGRGAEIGQDREEVELFGRAASARRLDEEIVEAGPALGGARHQEAAAAQRAEHRLGNGRRAESGQRRVERVAAVVKDLTRGLGRCRMTAGHGALLRLALSDHSPTRHQHDPQRCCTRRRVATPCQTCPGRPQDRRPVSSIYSDRAWHGRGIGATRQAAGSALGLSAEDQASPGPRAWPRTGRCAIGSGAELPGSMLRRRPAGAKAREIEALGDSWGRAAFSPVP